MSKRGLKKGLVYELRHIFKGKEVSKYIKTRTVFETTYNLYVLVYSILGVRIGEFWSPFMLFIVIVISYFVYYLFMCPITTSCLYNDTHPRLSTVLLPCDPYFKFD